MVRFLVLGWCLLTSTFSQALDLHNTLYEKIGMEIGIDPLLLYSVSLAESAYAVPNTRSIAPHPWTLRTDKPLYFKNQEQAEKQLQAILQRTDRVDVGLMQINVKWHAHRVTDALTLLNPETNLRVGATILKESLKSSPNDFEIGIGRFHSYDPERAKEYGQTVFRIYQDLVTQLD